VALSLHKALSEKNIRSGFATTGIFSFDRHVVDKFLNTLRTYEEAGAGNRPGQGGSTHELHDPLDQEAPGIVLDQAAQGPDSGREYAMNNDHDSKLNSEQINGEGGIGTVPEGVAADIEADFALEPAIET
jgi:hypothetical protein